MWVYLGSGMVALYLPIYLSIYPFSLFGNFLWVIYLSTILRGAGGGAGGGCGLGGAGVGSGAGAGEVGGAVGAGAGGGNGAG